MASPGCARGLDGELLDASAIQWFNDSDDIIPLPPSSAGATAGSSNPPSRSLSVATLDQFFSNVPPAKKIAGSRRSARVPRPSARSTHPDNAMAGAPSTRKRKGSTTAGASMPRRRARKVIAGSDGGNTTEVNEATSGSDEDSPSEDEGDGAGVDAEGAYNLTKALGDDDREVIVHCPSPTSR